MAARLIGTAAHFTGKQFKIIAEATIGKGPENNIVLSDRTISRRHARIYQEDISGGYILEDLNSRNGIRIDGERVIRRERLGNLQVITFGRCDFFFQLIDEQKQAAGKPDSRPSDKK
jgi:adenylate cyclase